MRQVNDITVKSNANLLACNTGNLYLLTKYAKQPQPDHILYGLQVNHENSHRNDRNFIRKHCLFHTQKRKWLNSMQSRKTSLKWGNPSTATADTRSSFHCLFSIGYAHFVCFHWKILKWLIRTYLNCKLFTAVLRLGSDLNRWVVFGNEDHSLEGVQRPERMQRELGSVCHCSAAGEFF